MSAVNPVETPASFPAETDDPSLFTLAVRASAGDRASRDRLFEAWPVLGPVVELHARRILHSVEVLAEDAEDDPFDARRCRI